MNFKAVIFDLDGTLLDTLEDLALSVNAVLKKEGFPQHPVEAYRYFVGGGIEMLVKRSLPEGEWKEEVLRRLIFAVRKEYSRRWADHTRPYPNVPEMLFSLEEQGVPKAILSNKPHDITELMVKTLLGKWEFAAVLGALPHIPRKPDPAGALKLAKQLKALPEEIVCVGDTAVDMRTAVAAKMYPVGALWGFCTAEELMESGARFLAKDPLEVAGLFAGKVKGGEIF